MRILGLQARSRVQRDRLDTASTEHVHDNIRHPCCLAVLVQNLHVFAEEEGRSEVQRGTLRDEYMTYVVLRNGDVPSLEQNSVGPQRQQILRCHEHVAQRCDTTRQRPFFEKQFCLCLVRRDDMRQRQQLFDDRVDRVRL